MRVIMVREHLEGIPEHALPGSFSLRWYQRGDETHWLQIHQRADLHNHITPDLFHRAFASDIFELARRQCYLTTSKGRAIGTASAWFNDNFEGRSIGRVHYVAILPEFQGRGLSRPLMTAICRRLRELGHERVYLTTSTERIAAIRLYRSFGFVPLIRTDEEQQAWMEFVRPAPK